MRKTALLLLALSVLSLASPPTHTQACGGLFCTNSPVDQSAERIIFAVNEQAGTIDAYVQINYTGSSDQFAWVVPVPNPPQVDVADMALFNQLDLMTAPRYIAPRYDCFRIRLGGGVAAGSAPPGDVIVYRQGGVGSYNYAVVGSEDPKALVHWLRENKYQISQEMEPLVDVYVKERMVFLAMKLQPQKGV